MKKLLLVLSLTLCSFSVSTEEIDPEKVKLIDKLLEQTGQSATNVGQQFSNIYIHQMTAVLRSSQEEIDPKAFMIVEEEIKAIIHDEIVVNQKLAKLLHPIYSKHFTVDELKQMVELNDTPFGQKIIRVMPLITQEGIQAGQTFGQTLGPMIQMRIKQRFDEEGIQ